MKDFLKKLFAVNDEVSSKRVIGTILILFYMAVFLTTYFTEMQEKYISMANNLLYVGGGLLGIGVFDKATAK